MTNLPILSKSRFIRGSQCLKALYLTCYHSELKDEVSQHNLFLMETGTKVGELARRYFPKGMLIEGSFEDPKQADLVTTQALNNPDVDYVFEGSFTSHNLTVRVDIIKKNRDGTLDLIEVKSSTSARTKSKFRDPKPHYLDDLGFQKTVVEGCGHQIQRSILMHLSSAFISDEHEIDLDKLFVLDDLTSEVNKAIPSIAFRLNQMQQTILQDRAPTISVGSHCKMPNRCSFFGYCRQDYPSGHVTSLYKVTDKQLASFRKHNIELIKNIPEDLELTPIQQRIASCHKNDTHFVGPRVYEEMSKLSYPIYFMDFETSNPALPIFPGFGPWSHIPFQWSVHKLDRDGQLSHLEFLVAHDRDPRQEFAESLTLALGARGSVVVYFENFEKGIIRNLAKYFGRSLGESLTSMESRIFDLYRLVIEGVYLPGFGGSFSLKKVLPALNSSLKYEGMKIPDGASALMTYQRLIDPTVMENEKLLLRAGLRKYCKLDTLAMVEIFKKLLDLSSKVHPKTP